MTLSQVGRYIGPYELQEEIGRGGMSRVYRAYDPTMDREVAVKILTANIADDEEYQRRFRREITTASDLEHPFILPVYDYGRDENALFLVMPFVPRGTLHDVLQDRGVLTPQQAALVARQMGEALDFAHSRNIVHRDLKPHNIMVIDDDHYCLSDFGLVKLGNESTQLTFTGILLGSPAYMSPEQASARAIDGRSDVYSLGIVLYEALMGRRPFNGDTPVELITHHLAALPIRPSWINPTFPRPLERVLMRAMEKDPADRYASAGSLADAFCRAVEDMSAELRNSPLVSTQQVEASLVLQHDPATELLKKSAQYRKQRLAPWAAILLLAFALCGTIFGLQSLVIGPLRQEMASIQATAQALENSTPIVITQIVTNAAGEERVVTIVATRTPSLTATPSPTATSAWTGAWVPTAAPPLLPNGIGGVGGSLSPSLASDSPGPAAGSGDSGGSPDPGPTAGGEDRPGNGNGNGSGNGNGNGQGKGKDK